MQNSLLRLTTSHLPGLALTAAVGGVAWLASMLAGSSFRAIPLDAVMFAIVAGIALRSAWEPPASLTPGLDYASRSLLELAIVLLGLSSDLRVVLRAGAPLAIAIVACTTVALAAGIAWGRVLGLRSSHALLIAAGNAICGNSAIAAVAAVTEAPKEETASAIAYTALLSLVLVLLLPVARAVWTLGDLQYGIATGLTVYAVPQVLAAAYPVSVAAGQVGTMVKLVRVLLLVPLVAVLSLRRRRGVRGGASSVAVSRLVPWYVAAFVLAAMVRSAGLVPDALARGAQRSSHVLTVISMAALGLGVEIAALRRVGWRTAVASTVSLLTLCFLAALVVMLLTMPRAA